MCRFSKIEKKCQITPPYYTAVFCIPRTIPLPPTIPLPHTIPLPSSVSHPPIYILLFHKILAVPPGCCPPATPDCPYTAIQYSSSDFSLSAFPPSAFLSAVNPLFLIFLFILLLIILVLLLLRLLCVLLGSLQFIDCPPRAIAGLEFFTLSNSHRRHRFYSSTGK